MTYFFTCILKIFVEIFRVWNDARASVGSQILSVFSESQPFGRQLVPRFCGGW